jgi:diguanylate cyclase (GGDEF)-like protein
VLLASDVAAYRWLAVHFRTPPCVFIHADHAEVAAAEVEARAALRLPEDLEFTRVCDDRAVVGRATPPLTAEVRVGGRSMGAVAMGPSPRGASNEDRQLVAIFSAELGGPLRIVSLVEQARHMAMSDPLTGLLNRRAGMDALLRGMASFDRHGHPLAIMLLDIDHFKRVNDTHGHEAGDAVLSGVAEVMRAMARRTDSVIRWGGEEFVVVLGNTGLPSAAIPAERLRKAIMDHMFRLPDGAQLQVTASIGLAAALKGERADALIARADQAMYLAKSRGRNRCVIHDANASVPQPHNVPR